MATACIISTASLGYVLLIAVHPALVSCNFLATRDDEQLSSSLASSDHVDLLYELEANAGRDHRTATERRVARLEQAMRPTFEALPKDKSGRLGASGIRYLLHRLFVQRHGWFVKGLDREGDAWNTSSPTEFVGTHINEEIKGAFDKQLNTHGFDLHHVAVLAATLENFVHVEAVERLQAAYRVTGLEPSDGNAPEAKVTRAMHTYLVMYILHKKIHFSDVTPDWADKALKRIHIVYPTWDRTLQFMEAIRNAVLEEESASASDTNDDVSGTSHSWNVALKILERFGEGYGRWQNQDCMDLKRKLVQMEEPNTGRVPLHRFYGNLSSDSFWHFSESVSYLKMLGAIDESDPRRVSVIIPNYLNGPNNCVAGSKFYDVCCIDECDALVSHLEGRFAASQAPPEKIAELVAQLPSDTVEAPRKLSRSLLQRLEQIADHHGGLVPLHGRLFSQWMHHAYPRECLYPHISGTTNPMTPREYAQETGTKASIGAAQASQIIEQTTARNDTEHESNEERDLPWSAEEELFVCKPGQSDVKRERRTPGTFTLLAFVIPVAFCIMVTLERIVPRTKRATKACASNEKHYV